MLKIGLFHFFALVIVTARLRRKLQPRIIRGFTCDTAEIPYFVLIDHLSVCGGSLLTYEWVLTAAHCIRPKLLDFKIPKVHSGFDMSSSNLRQVRNIKKVHSHPNFVEKDYLHANDFRYDIGLILVDKPFRQTIATHVATLPAPGFANQCNRVMTPGVGETFNNESLYEKPWEQRPLKCVNLIIKDASSCKEDYENVRGKSILFDDTIMCMFKQFKGSCRGDSGGPVLCDNVVIGLVSYGPADCERTPIATTFTMVEKHLDFIDNIVKFTRKSVT